MTESGACIKETTARPDATRRLYRVYGVALYSEIPLPLPVHDHGELARIELQTAPASFFSDILRKVSLEQCFGSFYELGRFTDGSIYARWRGVGEFLASGDGSRIFCRQFDESTTESFHVYLLGQALSFAIVRQGIEPFHGTAIVVDGRAAVLLGGSGWGKSSLAACFVAAGYRVLTDDLLIFQRDHGRLLAYPGPPRIKLEPEMADRFLRETAAGVRMNPETEKLILRLDARQSCSTAVPVAAIYGVSGPGENSRQIQIGALTARQGLLEMLENTFNVRVTDAERLERQFNEIGRIVDVMPIHKLSFPRVPESLPLVRDAIVSEVRREILRTAECAD